MKSITRISPYLLMFTFFLSPLQGDLKKIPFAVPGPAQRWDSIPQVSYTRMLTKPTQADTSFYLRDDLYASPVSLEEVEFYRLFENELIVVFAEAVEYDEQRVTDTDIERVVNALLYQTPPGSVNPQKGIWSNELDIFGEAPDVDGNGQLFVLLVDVRDDYEAGTSDSYVAGYFDPLDQNASQGNYSDIIYIDTDPARVDDEETLAVVAHELQHLIHYNHDNNESTWLNEGLSELAPRLLGYPVRSFAGFLGETNRSLNSFDGSLIDYAKVGLWTFYIYQRFGLDIISQLVAEPNNSLTSYEQVIRQNGYPSIAKEDLLSDWFIANLINNGAVADGRYSYGGVEIPSLYSEHFWANFTDDQTISDELQPAAADYIQFYSGSNIEAVLEHEGNPQFHLAVIKDFAVPEVNILAANQLQYRISDPDFGNSYTRLTLVAFNLNTAAESGEISFSYRASGTGGYAETELINDGDSLSAYISMQSYEAAEKFELPAGDASLAAIKFFVTDEISSTIRIYEDLEEEPIAEYQDVLPSAASWTRFDLDSVPLSRDLQSVYVSVTSPGNGLGYSATGQGQGRAFLNADGQFRDLTEFAVGDNPLDGDWLIRAVVSEPVVQAPELVVEPRQIQLWNNEYHSEFVIRNRGTMPLYWSISAVHPGWMEITPLQGIATTTVNQVEISIDRNLLKPGLYQQMIPITSNDGQDSVVVSILERNLESPQTAFLADGTRFADTLRVLSFDVFNIGIGEGSFGVLAQNEFLQFYPTQGRIAQSDTVTVSAYLDAERVNTRRFEAVFYNGIDSLPFDLAYSGELDSEPENTLEILTAVPNPFSPTEVQQTLLRVRLPNTQPAELKVYNILGQQVYAASVSGHAGLELFSWNGRDHNGQWAGSGVYFVVVTQGSRSARTKLLLLK